MADINVSIVQSAISVTMTGAMNQNFVIEDQKFFFRGLDSDTYFVYDSATSKLQLFVNGSKKLQWN